MKKYILIVGFTLALSSLFIVSAYSCTIFVLTDSKRTLFFNNEDYSNPSTHIWFLPRKNGQHGRAYVGFDNGYAQGGVNTEGLAFDWVAGYKDGEGYVPDGKLEAVSGNPTEKMMETCATVEEAIGFYQKYQETTFSYARIMIADKTGASVIIGAKNGKLYFDQSHQSRGFGYGGNTLTQLLSQAPKPTLKEGLPILQACYQDGLYATKYSSVYDLRSGEIFLLPAGENKEMTKLNLEAELAKGRHTYDIPQIALSKNE